MHAPLPHRPPHLWGALSTFPAETRIEIADSVRGKDVFIMQTGGG